MKLTPSLLNLSLAKNAVSVAHLAVYSRILTSFVQDCGDITDVTANNGVFGAESECATPCPGDPIHICGDGNRLTTYFWNGTMNDWKTPANTGHYEVRGSSQD